jgi:hypothetical protein
MCKLQDKEEKDHKTLWKKREALQKQLRKTYIDVSSGIESIIEEQPNNYKKDPIESTNGDGKDKGHLHDIMSLALPSTILSHWRYGSKEYENISRTIQKDSASIIEQAISDKKEWIKREGREIPENFDDSDCDRFHALLIGFAKRIMRKYQQPRRAITEITITNTKNFHEGRLDAILEYSYGYGVIDWKAYDIDPVTSNGHEKWQLISNLLLANYRFTSIEQSTLEHEFQNLVLACNLAIQRTCITDKKVEYPTYELVREHEKPEIKAKR